LPPSVVASELEQIAADLLNQPERAPLYAAVVVDEAQDLDLASFSLQRALVGEARATEETRAWATGVLHGVDFDDLDGGCDSASITAPCSMAMPHWCRASRIPRRRAALPGHHAAATAR